MFSPKDQDRGGRRGKAILRILKYCLKTLPNAVLQLKIPRATPNNVKDREIQSLIQSYRCLPLSISVNVSILQDSCKISVYSIICV